MSVYNIETITLVKISVLVYIKEILSMIYQTKIRLPITSCYFAKSGVWVFFCNTLKTHAWYLCTETIHWE